MKNFNDLSEEELRDLYFVQDKSKKMICDMYGISLGTLNGRLKKFGLNKMHKTLHDAFDETRKKLGEKVIMDALFSQYDNPKTADDDELIYGPAKIIGGKYKGRICCFDDEEDRSAVIYWGHMIDCLDKYEVIPLRYISSNVTTYDLVKRNSELSGIIRKKKMAGFNDKEFINYEEISDLYSEYCYVKDLLNERYIDFITKRQDKKRTVFISHKHNTEFESQNHVDYNMCLATDLSLLGYDVWYDSTEIKLGASIPCEMNKGITKADYIILMITKEYLTSNFCNDEWMAFYQKNNQKKPSCIIPVILEEGIKLPPLLAHYKYYDFSKNSYYQDMLDAIAKSLKE